MKKNLRERLLSKAVINWETGCWEWAASKDRYGYGKFSIKSVHERAHRVAYELIEGPIPASLQLDHLCRNRSCINPAHLEPVAPSENVMRGQSFAALNAIKTHCPAGHEYTSENTYRWRNARHCRTCVAARKTAYRAKRKAAVQAKEAA